MPGKHFVLTHGRSGSNFLVNSINLHPDLVNYGEVLGEWTLPYKLYQFSRVWYQGWPVYLDSLYTKKALFYASQLVSAFSHIKKHKPLNLKRFRDIQSIGIKDFAFLLEKRDLLDYLVSRDDIKIIYLSRDNHLKRYISLLNMKKTGQVLSEGNFNLSSKNCHSVNIPELLSSLDQYEKEEKAGLEILAKIQDSRKLLIEYDHYFSSEEVIKEINREVFSFLGVENFQLVSQHKKIMSNNLPEIICNFDEVAEALSGTEYEKYLSG